jgi:hypothetical protein
LHPIKVNGKNIKNSEYVRMHLKSMEQNAVNFDQFKTGKSKVPEKKSSGEKTPAKQDFVGTQTATRKCYWVRKIKASSYIQLDID